MTADDWERLREYLRQFGELDPQFKYMGTSRVGTREPRLHRARRAQEAAVAERAAEVALHAHHEFRRDRRPGGDDDGAGGRHGPHRRGLPAQGRPPRAARVAGAADPRAGPRRRGHVSARRRSTSPRRPTTCSIAFPMHLLAGIEHNFPADIAAGFTAMPRGKLFKIGLQMKERFWEREGIYRRHFLDAAGHPADLVSRAWHPSPEGRGARGVHVRSEGRREIRAADAGRAHQAGDRSRARRSIPTTASTWKTA